MKVGWLAPGTHASALEIPIRRAEQHLQGEHAFQQGRLRESCGPDANAPSAAREGRPAPPPATPAWRVRWTTCARPAAWGPTGRGARAAHGLRGQAMLACSENPSQECAARFGVVHHRGRRAQAPHGMAGARPGGHAFSEWRQQHRQPTAASARPRDRSGSGLFGQAAPAAEQRLDARVDPLLREIQGGHDGPYHTLRPMAMGKWKSELPAMWGAATDLPVAPGHPCYTRLTTILDGADFDRFAEAERVSGLPPR